MEANTRTPRELFDGKDHFEIPTYQRPYVWNREDQWEPLWQDIVRVAESVIPVLGTRNEPEIPHHFLGAVVYESRTPVAGGVVRHNVVDGQQRMTTLQILINAVQKIVAERNHVMHAEELEGLTLNRGLRFQGTRERFKLWPSQTDRLAFEHAMDPEERWSLESHGIISAHQYFYTAAQTWIIGEPDEFGAVPPGTEETRVETLAGALQDRLVLVAINLSGHDDAQLIFETLNDRGTPLLKADLIKNWVFRKGEKLGADTEKWARTFWTDFDGPWWREEHRQGRHQRSRVDMFIQYWLTMRLSDSIRTEHIFRDFIKYADQRSTDIGEAEQFLRELRADADTYRSFSTLKPSEPEGRFYETVIGAMEQAATTPVFLWLLSKNHVVPAEQREQALEALESWVVRRTLLMRSMRDVTRLMIVLLKALNTGSPSEAGDIVFTVLSEQNSASFAWPSDSEMLKYLPQSRVYGNIRQSRLRLVYAAVEKQKRKENTMYEAVSLPEHLELEHIMPQAWRTHWDPAPRLSLEASANRDYAIHSLGNLTLITQKLNGSLSNRPWTDASSENLVEGGESGKGKRSLIEQYSLLVLNKEIITSNPQAWTEDDIARRSIEIVQTLNRVWQGPDLDIQQSNSPLLTSSESTNSDAEFTLAEIQVLAENSGDTIKIVLDSLSLTPGEGWSGRDFADKGLTKWAHTALGGITNMVRARLSRTESPVTYENHVGTWYWSVNSDFATKWRKVRGLSQIPVNERSQES